MIGADGLRLALLVVAPLWIDWTPDNALALLLVTVFVTGVAERFWTVARESAAPALLPAPPPEGAAVRPLPDHLDALRRLWPAYELRRRSPLAAAALRRRHAGQQPARLGHRLVLAAPGGPRFVRRGRALRRLRLDAVLPRTARLADPAAAFAAGGPAPPVHRQRPGQGPYGRHPAARPRPARRSPARSPPPSPSPYCTPRTWAAGPSPSRCWSLALTGGTGRRHPRRRRPCCPRCPGAGCSPSRSPSPVSRCSPWGWCRTRRPCCSSRCSPASRAGVAANTGHALSTRRPRTSGGPGSPSTCRRSYGSSSALGALVGPAARRRDRAAPAGERRLRLRARRRGVHADAGRRAAAAGRRAGARQDRRPVRRAAAARSAGRAARRATTRRRHRPRPASSSPWRAATGPGSPPRSRRSPSGSGPRATRSW